jgi:hypothetical protein
VCWKKKNQIQKMPTSTDLPQSLFGAWDWSNYLTSLGAMLSVCSFTFLAGLLTLEDPVQRIPHSTPSISIDDSTLSSFLFGHSLGFIRGLAASLICSTLGELALFLTIMLISCVDLERVLGSTKLREGFIILGIQRILLQVFVLNPIGKFIFSIVFQEQIGASATSIHGDDEKFSWSIAPSAAWMAVTVAMMRRILVPPHRNFHLFGLPLDEQIVSDFFVVQILCVTEDSWCFVSCAIVSLFNCTRFSLLHMRSRLLLRKFFWWEDDNQVKRATVLARFLPVSQQRENGINDHDDDDDD